MSARLPKIIYPYAASLNNRRLRALFTPVQFHKITAACAADIGAAKVPDFKTEYFKVAQNKENSLPKIRRSVIYLRAEQNGDKTLQKNLAYF